VTRDAQALQVCPFKAFTAVFDRLDVVSYNRGNHVPTVLASHAHRVLAQECSAHRPPSSRTVKTNLNVKAGPATSVIPRDDRTMLVAVAWGFQNQRAGRV
jgi:hypothetical protein